MESLATFLYANSTNLDDSGRITIPQMSDTVFTHSLPVIDRIKNLNWACLLDCPWLSKIPKQDLDSCVGLLKQAIIGPLVILQDNTLDGNIEYIGPLRPREVRVNSILFLGNREENEWLERFGTGYAIKNCSIGPPGSTTEGDEYKIMAMDTVELVDIHTGIDVHIDQVGVGISQLLPVVFAACNTTPLVCIQQPEVHLHPAMQVVLGDLFIDRINPNRYVLHKFLIETHSEHLLLRIMRRLRETSRNQLTRDTLEIHPRNVAVYYVERHEDTRETLVLQMPLDKDGDLLKSWPGGFFEEGLDEVLA